MLRHLLMAVCLFCIAATAGAQTVTTEPSPLRDDSHGVTIYFHAAEGNGALANQAATAALYAHTGVITNTSASDSDWQYAPTWLDNSEKYRLQYVSPNLWKLDIGDIHTYYGITNPDVVVRKLAFVFRNANGTLEGKGPGNTDIFVDVESSRLLLSISSTIGGNIVTPGNEKAKLTLTANQPADLTLEVNGTAIGSASASATLTADYTFAAPGSYTVRGTARNASETVTAEETFILPLPSAAVDFPGGVPVMGQTRNADGSVTFCLGAPQKTGAIIVGSWDDFEVLPERAMNYQDYNGFRYFWTTVKGLDDATTYLYYYLVDGTLKVGDPYAKLILDPYNDSYIPASVFPNLPAYPSDKVTDVPLAVWQGNINDYDWQVTDFKGADPENLIIYELLLRDFTGTEGKALGDGTVRKAIARIPYLKALGVNAVELLPINEFNGNISWGYNPNFYFAPDKAYGTPDDYKEFIDLCHQNGIAVILDIVFNQTDWLHPWYQLYPVGKNPFYNADAPHAYSVLNDWNQDNAMLQQHFHDVLRYWVEEYKVDGYRFDLVKGLGDNDSYANNGDAATNAYNASRVARMRELQLALQEVKPDAYFINENLAEAKEENEMAAFGQLNWANLNSNGCNFAEGNQGSSGLNRMYAPDNSRLRGSTVSYLESHDEQRLAYMQNTAGVKGVAGNMTNSMHRLGSAAAQMILTPGSHMIWQFSELGNYDNTKNANGGNNTDPKTVRWNLYDVPARRGLHDEYAALCSLRNNYPELFGNDSEVTVNFLDSDWTKGRRISLRSGEMELYAAINPLVDGEPMAIEVPFAQKDNSAYRVLVQSYGTQATFDAAAGTITVAPNCFAVVGLADMTGVEDIILTAEQPAARAIAGGLSLSGHCEVYDLSGLLRYSGEGDVALPAGLYIVRGGDVTTKVLVR